MIHGFRPGSSYVLCTKAAGNVGGKDAYHKWDKACKGGLRRRVGAYG